MFILQCSDLCAFNDLRCDLLASFIPAFHKGSALLTELRKDFSLPAELQKGQTLLAALWKI